MLDFSSYFSLGVLGLISGASQFELGRSILGRHYRKIFIFSIIAIFSWQVFLALAQYKLWSASPLTQLLLPPHQGIDYFLSFVISRLFLPYLISLAIALFMIFLLPRLNKKFDERFFETEEPYFAALAVFLVGHPGWLIYLVVLISLYLILHTAYFILRREAVRLSPYRLWGATALFVILINEYWLSQTNWWSRLGV
ncbi:MAG: hypothetical protein HYS89_02530 [Candidatus Colwellbacteria bacterium]|nr:hypothetical protein [Candidatus Colwellbacteria bacterium]